MKYKENSMQKHIVFLRTNGVNPDSRVEKESSSLVKHGYKVTIIAWDREAKYKYRELTKKIAGAQVTIVRFGINAVYGGGSKIIFPYFLFCIRVWEWLYKNRREYDCIHACDIDTALEAVLVGRILKKKIVFDIFDFRGGSLYKKNFKQKMLVNVQYYVIRHSNAVIICSDQRKEQIVGSRPKLLEVIHNSPSNLFFHETDLRLNRSKIKIVYCGILKDHRLLKETAEIIKNRQEYEFHIAGFGKYYSYFEKLSEENNNIYFYGKLPYDRVLNLEKNCDIMVALYDPEIENHYFAAPNKFYEALMLGKPLIMARETGMSNVIEENQFGIIVEYSQEGFLKGLDYLHKNINKYLSKKDQMYILYKKEYSWNNMEKKLIQLYEKVLEK